MGQHHVALTPVAPNATFPRRRRRLLTGTHGFARETPRGRLARRRHIAIAHMDIELRCPVCDRLLRVQQQYADRLVGCACGHITDCSVPHASARSIIDEVGRKGRLVDRIMWGGGALVLLVVGFLAGGQGVDVPLQPLSSAPINGVAGKTAGSPRSGTEWREPNAPTSPPKNPASVISTASRDGRSAHSEGAKKAETSIVLEAGADADKIPNKKPPTAVATGAATRVVTGHEWRSAPEGAGLGELSVRTARPRTALRCWLSDCGTADTRDERSMYGRARRRTSTTSRWVVTSCSSYRGRIGTTRCEGFTTRPRDTYSQPR